MNYGYCFFNFPIDRILLTVAKIANMGIKKIAGMIDCPCMPMAISFAVNAVIIIDRNIV